MRLYVHTNRKTKTVPQNFKLEIYVLNGIVVFQKHFFRTYSTKILIISLRRTLLGIVMVCSFGTVANTEKKTVVGRGRRVSSATRFRYAPAVAAARGTRGNASRTIFPPIVPAREQRGGGGLLGAHTRGCGSPEGSDGVSKRRSAAAVGTCAPGTGA